MSDIVDSALFPGDGTDPEKRQETGLPDGESVRQEPGKNEAENEETGGNSSAVCCGMPAVDPVPDSGTIPDGNGPEGETERTHAAGRILQISWISLSVLFLFCVFWLAVHYAGMRPFATNEYGEDLPDASVFMPGHVCVYAEIPDDVTEKGMHTLTLQTDKGMRTVWIRVKDTVAPAAEGVRKTISTLQTLRPDELIRNLKDNDRVKVSFLETPPFGTAGDYQPVILLEDMSGNRSSITAELAIRATREGVTVEAGAQAPAAEIFLIDEYEVESCTPISEEMLHTPGEYPVFITIAGTAYTSLLRVVDTVAPKAETQMLLRMPDDSVEPYEFLKSVQDETEVEAVYIQAPDPASRELQTVVIRLTDKGNNSVDVEASLLFSHAKPLVIEAREEPLTATECIGTSDQEEDVSLTETFVPNRVGTYAVKLSVNGIDELALVEVRDTVPPVLTAEDRSWFVNHPLDPRELCTSVLDVTETVVGTESEIDWSYEGTQSVTLTATDAGGNTASAVITLSLTRDTVPPVLYGVINRNCYVGEPVSYFSEVFATDNLDDPVTVEVDKSAVRADHAGTYSVTYRAVDSDGNETRATCKFRFVNSTVTDEQVQALAREVLDRILTDDMTRTEQLEAIYNYVRGHVHYVNASDKKDWRKEAERGIRTGRGDCFTFYSVTRALLDQIDVEYMSVTRKGGRTRHYWVIVNVGTGWYHFDPTIASRHKHRCFMWTNRQCKVKPYFWRFDESSYPQIATVPFDKNAVIAAERKERDAGK